MPRDSKITVTKLQAARCQLRTAIELWFAGGDPVPIHTLAFASYEIIHVISRPKRSRDLLFDWIGIKDEGRKEWALKLKKAANFFKHANNDAVDSLDFDPKVSEMFMMFSILGLELLGERANNTELAFVFWLMIHNPRILSGSGRKLFEKTTTVDQIEQFRSIEKRQFFETFSRARREAGHRA